MKLDYIGLYLYDGITSFEEIPIPLEPPDRGETYTLKWAVQDQEFVKKWQEVLEYTSDSSGNKNSFYSPVPGCVHIHTHNQSFVHHENSIGSIKYGLSFGENKSLPSNENMYLSEEDIADAYRFFSFQSEQTETLRERVEQKRKRNAALKNILSPDTSDSTRESDISFPDQCAELLQRLPTLSETEKKEVSSGSALNLLFESYSFLNELLVEQGHVQNYQIMTEDERRIHAIDTVDKLYQWKTNQAKHNPFELPEAMHQEKLHLWDQLREAHLENIETSEVNVSESDSGNEI